MASMTSSSELLSAPGHLIRRAQQVHTVIWAATVGAELTSIQFAMLATIQAQPRIDQRSLGETIAVDTSTVAEVTRRLVRRGLVARRRSSTDGRRYELVLTDEGAELLREVTPAANLVTKRLVASLSGDEQAQLVELLRRVTCPSPDTEAHGSSPG